MNVVLIHSSVRANQLGPSIVEIVKPFLRKSWNVQIIDPKTHPLPLLYERYYETVNPLPDLEFLHKVYNNADGFILVTAEYNHSIPPALKNMLDHFTVEFAYKACGIISYSDGAYGGVRAAEHLRLVCTNLKMPPVTAQPAITFAGKKRSAAKEKELKKVMRLFINQFEWYLEALKRQRTKGLPGSVRQKAKNKKQV
jgi:NAD(P)H-dependent FMN reductase